ncbi:MAG TPA: YoaK family protein [Microlunatus sp.]
MTVTSSSLRFAVLMTACGGFLDAYTVLARGGVFATAQTGNVVFRAVPQHRRAHLQCRGDHRRPQGDLMRWVEAGYGRVVAGDPASGSAVRTYSLVIAATLLLFVLDDRAESRK